MDEAAGETREHMRPLTATLAAARQDPGLAAIVAMALAGIGISTYLTVIHYENVPALCSTSGVVNCESVLHSAFSNVPFTTIPITVPGLLWFLVSGGLAAVGLASIARNRPEPERLRQAQVLWSAAGLLFVLYLVYAEIVRLHAICLWCTGVHILTLLIFLVALNRLQTAAAPSRARAANGRTRPAQPHPSAHVPASRSPATRKAAARRQAGTGRGRAQTRSRRH